MRRPINWLVVVINLAFLAFGLTVSGGRAGADQTADGMLCPMRDGAELASPLKSAIGGCSDAGSFEDAAVPPAATTADFSMTFTIEEAVYELDSVRYDDHRLFVTIPADGVARPAPVMAAATPHRMFVASRRIDDRIVIVSRHALREAVHVPEPRFDSQAGSAEIPGLLWSKESTDDGADSLNHRLFGYLPDLKLLEAGSIAFIDGDAVSSWDSPSQVNGSF